MYTMEEEYIALTGFLEGAGIFPIDELNLHKYLKNEGWIIHPVHCRGKIIGAIVEREGVIHTSISTKFQKRWNPRPYIMRILYPALDKYKEIFSDAAKDDPRGQRWLLKLGFKYIREDESRIYYRLTEKLFT